MASPIVLALSVSGEVEGAGHHTDVHQVVHDPGLDVALVLVHHHLGALALISSSSHFLILITLVPQSNIFMKLYSGSRLSSSC